MNIANDDPVSFGIYTDEDLSKRKMFGLKFIGEKNSLERNDMRKFSISKVSIIIFLIFICLGGLAIFLNS